MLAAPVTSLSHARNQLYERGFAVIEEVLAREQVARIAQVAMDVAEQEMVKNPGSAFTVDRGIDGALAPRKIDYPFLKHPAFREFVLHPRLQELADTVLGEPAFLMRDQLFAKPPHFGSSKPYHQENASLGYAPADGMIVMWVALDDATLDNGCLRVIDRSHRALLAHSPQPGASYNHVPQSDSIDVRREMLLPVRAGGVVVLHSQVLHCSAVNNSPQWRRAYSSHWVVSSIACRTNAQRFGYSRTAGGGQGLRFRAP
ncbi:phytanoyl-CoA dioxygenase family protein [Nocardia jejuensis]|uniref:phytanoyl-CoA dioxygenase family protein n=1 Tax=Nocardia jejuensis TaxID=328049 RepID=UPI00082D33A8|nr:phytanoyl-CoA dioxygenase family protein [Nocardia jejuensis]